MDSELKDIRLEDLVPFKGHTGQAYKGERLQQLMDSIEKTGLISPIIVRPADNGKYEILCGHNRVKAVRTLGHDTIRADVRYKVSDDMALELFFDSNLNQQSFLDWSYSQRFEAVKYIETLIKETSRQGKRTDLEKETAIGTDNGTYVQSRHKLTEKPKRITVRDRMSKRFGISTATLSKYRRIIKLPDDLLRSLEQLLDEKRITFEAAYIIANMIDFDIEILVEGIIKNPDKILDLAILKNLPHRNDEKPGVIYPKSRKRALAALKPRPSSDVIAPVRKTK
ncbi:ParB N-terminal domain-containing protein [uncultured Acetatifactor sp.]|uniref:ParB/RepB/Spo0J family partition protein n=1 Tax=uncultured Acetatifactor sp. TaxID=1671927 RepID=UPI00272DC730|nr:ParB N-terminal domain-containing protein [uncultured Acetatifactor sp.]